MGFSEGWNKFWKTKKWWRSSGIKTTARFLRYDVDSKLETTTTHEKNIFTGGYDKSRSVTERVNYYTLVFRGVNPLTKEKMIYEIRGRVGTTI